MTVNNQVTVMAGVIDPDYRGEIKIVLYNYGDKTFTIQPKQKIAQLILEKVEIVETEITKSLDKTNRAGKGFGSTYSITPMAYEKLSKEHKQSQDEDHEI